MVRLHIPRCNVNHWKGKVEVCSWLFSYQLSHNVQLMFIHKYNQALHSIHLPKEKYFSPIHKKVHKMALGIRAPWSKIDTGLYQPNDQSRQGKRPLTFPAYTSCSQFSKLRYLYRAAQHITHILSTKARFLTVLEFGCQSLPDGEEQFFNVAYSFLLDFFRDLNFFRFKSRSAQKCFLAISSFLFPSILGSSITSLSLLSPTRQQNFPRFDFSLRPFSWNIYFGHNSFWQWLWCLMIAVISLKNTMPLNEKAVLHHRAFSCHCPFLSLNSL